VWRLTGAERAPVRYLKVAGPETADDVARETEVLAWLRGRFPVPVVVEAGTTGDQRWLLTEGLPGRPADAGEHRLGGAERLAEAFGTALRAIHDLPTDGCPFSASLDELVSLAERRVAAGRVDPSDFEPLHQRYPPAALFERLLSLRPDEGELAFTHGDYGLPNVLLVPGAAAVSGVVDWALAGVGDPYRDLAVAARSLAHRTGPEVVHRCFDAYGLAHPDLGRLDFFVLLDEFF
jgi:kanamycin kinase/aminoglycoside 3'-phosphotransferase-2